MDNSQIDLQKKDPVDQKNLNLSVLERILNGMDALVYVTDPTTDEILFINDKMRERFGFGANEGVGMICWKALRKGMPERCPFCPKYKLKKHPDETVVWEEHKAETGKDYLNSDNLIEWADGRLVHMQHSVEVTEVKKGSLTQQELMSKISSLLISENYSEKLLPSAMKMVGEHMGYTRVLLSLLNQQASKLTITYEWSENGTKTDEKDISIPFVPDNRISRSIIMERKAVISHEVSDTEKHFRSDKYGIKSFLSIPIYLKDELFGILSFDVATDNYIWESKDTQIADFLCGVFAGVFDRTRTGANLLKMSSLVESVMQPIVYIATDESVAYYNDATFKVFGYTREEFLEGGVELLFGKEMYERVRTEVWPQSFAAGFVEGVELQMIHKDGRVLTFSFLGFVINVEGELPQLATIGTDITDLIDAKDRAEDASRAKGDFLSRMSHEIRTPMNAIKGLAELLALTELDNIQDGYVQNIVKSSNSLLSIVNDVLDFSKINENRIEFIDVKYYLADLVAEVSSMVNLRATEKGLMLLMEISPFLPKELLGDDVRVKQVIINILNNAVKYTPKGYVTLRLFGEDTDNGFELVCAVEDSGIGIRKEDIPFLFEAFSQADRKVNHNIQGTGLGLSISDRLARGMGGSITVESEYGKGSIFTARFPQRVECRDPIAVVENPEEKHVLILHSDVRANSLAAMLEELDITYKTVSSEEELLHITNENYSHIIYGDTFSDNSIRRLVKEFTDVVFIAIKDMRYAVGQSELHDTVLFRPLLITELVKALALIPGQVGTTSASEKTIDDFVLDGTHVLVVDDNEINLIVSGEILRAYKAEVTCAEGGQIALDLCEEQKFDLIFMDHMMPEMDGVETTVALRAGQSINKETPIIALTANVINDVASYYLENGMNDFISKPIDLNDLRRVLLKWLPEEKITTMENVFQPEASSLSQTKEQSMERLIQSFDAFGMYVSDVMREIDNDYDVFFERMERIHNDLAPLVARLRDQVRLENWADFAGSMGEMSSMIHDVGARDCSGRARKLANAGKENNADYIKSDFFSLMDNMYMLEKKMEVAVPLVLGNISPDVPFGDLHYCYDRLLDMKVSLSDKDYDTSLALLDSLEHYSLDHDLDLILVGLGAKLAEHDFDGVLALHEQAIQHCESILSV